MEVSHVLITFVLCVRSIIMHEINYLPVVYVLETLPGALRGDWLSWDSDLMAPSKCGSTAGEQLRLLLHFWLPFLMAPPGPWSPPQSLPSTSPHSSQFLPVCSLLLPASSVLFLFLFF